MFVLLLATAIAIAPAVPLDEQQSEVIRLAEERGQRLFRYHRIAPYAADLGKREIGKRFSEVGGYVAIEETEAQVLTFIGSANAKDMQFGGPDTWMAKRWLAALSHDLANEQN